MVYRNISIYLIILILINAFITIDIVCEPSFRYKLVYSFYTEKTIMKSVQYGSITIFLYSLNGAMDNSYIVAAFNSSKQIWDIETVSRGQRSKPYISDIEIVDKYLLMVISNNSISIIDINNGTVIKNLKIPISTLKGQILFIDYAKNERKVLIGFRKGATILDLKNFNILWNFYRINTSSKTINTLVTGGFFNGSKKVFILGIETFCHICLTREEKHLHIFDLNNSKFKIDLKLTYIKHVYPLNFTYFAFISSKGVSIAKIVNQSSIETVSEKNIDMNGLMGIFFIPEENYYILIKKDKSSNIMLQKIVIPQLKIEEYSLGINATGIINKYDYGIANSTIIYLFIEKKYETSEVVFFDVYRNKLFYKIYVKDIKGIRVTDDLDTILIYDRNNAYLYKKGIISEDKSVKLSIIVKETDEKVQLFNITLSNETYIFSKTCVNPCSITLSKGEYNITLSADGYKPKSFNISVNASKTIVVVLEKIKYKLNIYVIDTSGEPLNIMVYIFHDDKLIFQGIVKGSKTFILEPGLYRIEGILGKQIIHKEIYLANSCDLTLIFRQFFKLKINIVNYIPSKIYRLLIVNTSNGLLIGEYDIKNKSIDIPLQQGVYKIQLESSGFKPYIAQIEITNSSKKIDVILQKSEFNPKLLRIYIFGSLSCPACRAMKDIIIEKYGEKFLIFRDISNETYLETYSKIYDLLELGNHYYIPLTLFFYNNTPLCAIVGVVSNNIIQYMVLTAYENHTFFSIDERGELRSFFLNNSILTQIKDLVIMNLSHVEKKYTLNQVLPIVISMALADSVNPCTFSIFTALLLMTFSLSKEKKKVWIVGLPFIFSIFLSYMLLGLGLVKIFSYIPGIKYVIVLLGLSFGIFSILSGWGEEFKSPLPRKFKEITENIIEEASKAINPITSAIAGFIISFTLLPCSSGPYLVATASLSKLHNYMLSFLLLMLYNFIFIIPLLLIIVFIVFFSTKLRVIKIWRTKKLGIMEIISGVLLILVSIYALLTI